MLDKLVDFFTSSSHGQSITGDGSGVQQTGQLSVHYFSVTTGKPCGTNTNLHELAETFRQSSTHGRGGSIGARQVRVRALFGRDQGRPVHFGVSVSTQGRRRHGTQAARGSSPGRGG